MTRPTTSGRARAAEARAKRTLLRCVGEHRIPYRVEVLELMARYVARDLLLDAGPLPEFVPDLAPEPARQPVPPSHVSLSSLDARVLRMLAEGCEASEVAQRLGATEGATKRRLKRIYVALGARNRAHAVALGYEAGVLVAVAPSGAAVPGAATAAVRPPAALGAQ